MFNILKNLKMLPSNGKTDFNSQFFFNRQSARKIAPLVLELKYYTVYGTAVCVAHTYMNFSCLF